MLQQLQNIMNFFKTISEHTMAIKMMGRNSDHNYFEPSHSAKRRLPLKSKPNRQLPQTCYWSQANKSASFRELILSYQILDLDYL